MNVIAEFLDNNKPFYVATIDDGKPRLRPFGASFIFEDKLYICTSNQKAVSRQFKKIPNIEISAAAPDGQWLRLTAEVTLDERREPRERILSALPTLKERYKVDDGVFEVYYLKNATGILFGPDGQSETHTF
ncbi:MAG: pyridoxamine 5'-phosphate oxidase family protein [Clostridiales bacterium]|jgi:uncharacterized pyridoxamine 5'-phosphate oxidase family protein|nr:pyridoxamine 5'-phosphate oxidase family protein [Clostridiales bacterium]